MPDHRTPSIVPLLKGTMQRLTMQSLHPPQAFMCRCLALP